MANRSTWMAVLLAAVLAAGCGKKSETTMIASAKSHLASGNAKAATIELKSALQINPNSGEARYLLGKTLLDGGDPVAAKVELEKAAELKYDVMLVVPALARAMVEQGEFKKVIETYQKFVLPDPDAQTQLRTSVATAQWLTGQREDAERTVDEILGATPMHVPAMLLRARLLAAKGDTNAATALLTNLLLRDGKNHEAWKLKGDLVLAANDRPGALDAYRKAVEFKPAFVGAHVGIIEILIGEKDTAGAAAQVAEMKKVLPTHPQTVYFDGVMAYLGKDYTRARDLATKLVQASPTNPMALQLAGAAEYQLRAFHQAETYLAKAVNLAPQLLLARTRLAQIQLRSGQPAKAVETLEPVLSQEGLDPEVLVVAAEAHLQNGEAKEAEALFARAVKQRPDDPRIKAARAMAKVRQGGGSAALGELESIASADAGTTADLALIAAHLRRREFDAALKAIDGLDKKRPDRPVAPVLRGRVLALKRDLAGARESFELALKRDPRYYPALASLSALDLAENKVAEARARFDAFLKTEPKHGTALLGLAALLQRSGAPPAEVVATLNRAIQAEPAQAAPRLRLVDHHLVRREHKEALSAAQNGLGAIPNHPELLHALGRVHTAMGDTQQAVSVFNQLVTTRSESPAAHIALGEVLNLRREHGAAEKSFRKALALKPDLLVAQRGLVAALIAERRHADALVVAKEAQKARPDGAGQLLEGDIESSRRNWDAAAAAYRASLKKTAVTDTAVRLHALLLTAGKASEAEQFAASWEAERPKDAVFRFYRADQALQKRDWALAETRYRAVMALQPNNALAMNNVAWLMVQQSKPGALEIAQRANQLMPNQPALMDTLATALAAADKVREAVEMQKQALALSPQDNTLRFNLAKLLVKAGDKPAARAELQQLEKLGPRFPDQDKVGELLKSVNS